MKNKFLWILMAVLSIVGGVYALANPVLAGGVATVLIGWVFVITGIIQAVAGFRAEGTGAKIWSILLGVLTVILGIMLLAEPLKGLVALTTTIAILLIIGGVSKLILSFSLEDRSFFWLVLISGVASLALGLVIFANWPVSAVSALGILLGVQFIADGISSLALALTSDGNEAEAA